MIRSISGVTPTANMRSALVTHLRRMPRSSAAALNICAGSANLGSRR